MPCPWWSSKGKFAANNNNKKKRLRARKQGWNKKMAADDSDIEDFKIDKETVLDNKINLKLYNCIIV